MPAGIEENFEMKCFECGGTIVRVISTFFQYTCDGSPILFEAVPLDECSQCGEKFLDAATLDRLQSVCETGGEARKVIEVPVVSFAT